MGRVAARETVRVLGRSATVSTCWIVGMGFALLDAASTWYALEILGFREANPVAEWVITHWGLSLALVGRVVLGAVVLGLLAIGCWVQLPRHRAFANRACRDVLVAALVLWGVVACSNTFQIALIKLR